MSGKNEVFWFDDDTPLFSARFLPLFTRELLFTKFHSLFLFHILRWQTTSPEAAALLLLLLLSLLPLTLQSNKLPLQPWKRMRTRSRRQRRRSRRAMTRTRSAFYFFSPA